MPLYSRQIPVVFVDVNSVNEDRVIGRHLYFQNEGDKPTIGLIFCKTKDNVFVEYVLRNFNRPIGVAEFEVKLVEKLPKDLKSNLPTVEEIEAELSVMPAEKKQTPRKKR